MCPYYFLITTLSYGTKDCYSKRPFCFPLALWNWIANLVNQWLWRRLSHRLSKRQSLTTVLLRTPITQMIFFNQGMLLLGSNHFLILVNHVQQSQSVNTSCTVVEITILSTSIGNLSCFDLLSNSNLQLKGLLHSVNRKLAQTNYFFFFFPRTDFRLREYPPSHMSSTLGTNSQTPSISWKPWMLLKCLQNKHSLVG